MAYGVALFAPVGQGSTSVGGSAELMFRRVHMDAIISRFVQPRMRFALMGLGQQVAYPRNIQQLCSVYSSNTGNLLFNYATTLIAELQGGRFPWGASAEHVQRRCDALVIPMANHLGSHTDLESSGPPISKYELPVVILGIGVQAPEGQQVSVPVGTQNWLHSVSQRSPSEHPNITTRGNLSSNILSSLSPSVNSVPLGCPSFFINRNPRLGQEISSRIHSISHHSARIAVSAGNPWKPHTLQVERMLLALVQDTSGAYIVQHPETMLELSLGFSPDPSRAEVVRERLFRDLSIDQMFAWFKLYSRAYISVPQWLLDMRRFDLHVGTRIHGSMAAIQAGIPSVCIYIDQRTKELCDFLQIPCLSVLDVGSSLEATKLLDVLVQWDSSKFDEDRMRLACSTADFLRSNLMTPSPHLLSIANG